MATSAIKSLENCTQNAMPISITKLDRRPKAHLFDVTANILLHYRPLTVEISEWFGCLFLLEEQSKMWRKIAPNWKAFLYAVYIWVIRLNPQSLQSFCVLLSALLAPGYSGSLQNSPRPFIILCVHRGMVWRNLSLPTRCSLMGAHNGRVVSPTFSSPNSCKRSEKSLPNPCSHLLGLLDTWCILALSICGHTSDFLPTDSLRYSVVFLTTDTLFSRGTLRRMAVLTWSEIRGREKSIFSVLVESRFLVSCSSTPFGIGYMISIRIRHCNSPS